MSRAADHDWRAYLLTALCTVIFIRTKANPLIVVFAAGVLGYFGIADDTPREVVDLIHC